MRRNNKQLAAQRKQQELFEQQQQENLLIEAKMQRKRVNRIYWLGVGIVLLVIACPFVIDKTLGALLLLPFALFFTFIILLAVRKIILKAITQARDTSVSIRKRSLWSSLLGIPFLFILIWSLAHNNCFLCNMAYG